MPDGTDPLDQLNAELDGAENPFGEVIYAYTRAQALEDGEQVDVSTVAREAGIKFPTFLTRAVWVQYVEVPPGVECQDEQGRLWDIVWMLHHAIRSQPRDTDRITFALYVRNTNGSAKLVSLKAMVGAVDIKNPDPAITVMMPDED